VGIHVVERWLPVVGWEGVYEVSDRGRVRSLDRLGQHVVYGTARLRGAVLRPQPDRKGYLRVSLGHSMKAYVHHLVLTSFVGPRPGGLLGLHKDGDFLHNYVGNLYWGTYSDNLRDAVAHGTFRNGNVGKPTCVNGHELTPENTYVRKNGWRQCKECQREANRRQRRKRKAAR
jgi:hypothetical protein